MKKLIEILKLTEFELKLKLYQDLKEKKMSPRFKDGFIYAKGDIPILLVAHLDTVFKNPPQEIYYDKEKDILYSDQGLGGDDRCGVYAIMKILEKYHPHILFTEAEEIDGRGAQKAVQKLLKPNVKYIIELDRKGNNDCVFYDCGNQKFIKYIENFGFVTNYETFSDISILAPAWDIAAVNISIGYYNEHTSKEYINMKELEKNINRIKTILQDHKNIKAFDFQEIIYPSTAFPTIFSAYLNSQFATLCKKTIVIPNDQPENTKKLTLKSINYKGD